MAQCFYHPADAAKAQCLGCRQPICEGCRDKGLNGFCTACFQRVSSLGAQVADVKKTGIVGSVNQKATIMKNVNAPIVPNVAQCFAHFDLPSTGTCPTCNRAYCAECLDPTTDLCRFCLALEAEEPATLDDPQEPVMAPRPGATTPRMAPREARRPASRAVAIAPPATNRMPLVMAVIAAIVLLGLVASILRKPARPHAAPAAAGIEAPMPDRAGRNPGDRQTVLGHDAGH